MAAPAAAPPPAAAAAAVPFFVKRLTKHATLPKRGSVLAAGYDLSRLSRAAGLRLGM